MYDPAFAEASIDPGLLVHAHLSARDPRSIVIASSGPTTAARTPDTAQAAVFLANAPRRLPTLPESAALGIGPIPLRRLAQPHQRCRIGPPTVAPRS